MNIEGNGREKRDKDFVFQEHVEKGKFYFISGKYEHAIIEYKKALEINPENTDILYSLGVAYESTNCIEEARDKYLHTLKLSPGHERAKEHLDKLLGK